MGFKSYARIPDVQKLPRLIEVQLQSFRWMVERGLRELFDEVTPIESFNKNLELHFPGIRNAELCKEFDLKFWFEEPQYSEAECVERDMTYAAPLYVKTLLYNREQDQPIVREIFFGDFPLMTSNGTFIINGTERVVVSQLIRSPGVYFSVEEDRATGRLLSEAKLIPDRGAWMEFETRKSDYIAIKFNRKRTIPVTIFLRALASLTPEDFQTHFHDAATQAMFAPGAGFFFRAQRRLRRRVDRVVCRVGHAPRPHVYPVDDQARACLGRFQQPRIHAGRGGCARVLQAYATG